MKFAAAVLALATAVSATVVKYDPVYNNAGQSLSTVACSDGSNGLLTKGFTTFSSLPSYPNIGASQYVGGYNDADCGSCWNITYQVDWSLIFGGGPFDLLDLPGQEHVFHGY